jgi:hypothetical protein
LIDYITACQAVPECDAAVARGTTRPPNGLALGDRDVARRV